MKDKRGFTLIELLAVIVILAVIMVIAVPQMLKVINASREKSASSSIALLKNGIKTQLMSDEINNINSFTKEEDGCYLFDFDAKNSNYQQLNVKNKENFTGTVKYCNGNFTDNNLVFDGDTTSSSTQSKKYYLYNYGQMGVNFNTSVTWNCNYAIIGDDYLECPQASDYAMIYSDYFDFTDYKTITVVTDNTTVLNRMYLGKDLNKTNNTIVYKTFESSIIKSLDNNLYSLTLDISSLTSEQKNAAFGFDYYPGVNGDRKVYQIYLEK